MRIGGRWLGAGLLLGLVVARSSFAFFLDDARRFDVRLRAYSQLGIMTEDSATQGCPTPEQVAQAKAITNPAQRQQQLAFLYQTCPPHYSAGDLGQNRNFYNPEFDANLTDFMGWAKADEFKFRFAWWGFYDGLYDYLSGPWNTHRQNYTTRYSQSDDIEHESKFFNDQSKNPRHIYASRNRINELYFDYTHGPFFLRIGRQAISWGESDSVAILDVSNPFDLTVNPFFSDPDESRIPLYTVRSTMKLPSVGPLTSNFGDVYLVPGIIDTTVSINPMESGLSPFSPDVADPNLNLIAQGQGQTLQTVLVDKLPKQDWGNSRWGARLTGVLWRDYTVQGWFLRTFSTQPNPVLLNQSGIGLVTKGQTTLVDDRGNRVPFCNNGFYFGRPCGKKAPVITALERPMESVVGLASTWFSPWANGILKWELEYFNGEGAFIPDQNLNPRVQLTPTLRHAVGDFNKYTNTLATADYVRWVIGYDRNFFARWLNPFESFTLVMAYNSSFNVSENGSHDYRFGTTKPGHPQTRLGPIPGVPGCQGNQAFHNLLCIHLDPHDYEDAYQYEGFLTTTLRTDYLHGRLEPQMTIITDVSGIFAWNVGASYRVTDNLLFGATYVGIDGSRKAGLGTFQSHDMIQLRATLQLN